MRRPRAPQACRSTSSTVRPFCDFAFGAIVNRSPLVIGISTDGASPVFGQAIRAKIEALIPKGFAAGPMPRGPGGRACKRWRCRSAAVAVFGSGSPRAPWPRPTAGQATPILTRCWRRAAAAQDGDGLGRSCRCRARRSGIVDLARGTRAAIGRRDPVRRSGRRRHPRFRAPRGEENAGRQNRPRAVVPARRNQRADDLARQSRPARGAAQRRRSDDFRTRRRRNRRLPCGGHRGRSRARHHDGAGRRQPLLASLTRRGEARRVQYITGHGHDGKLPLDIDWDSVADPGVTTVVYMPTKTLPELVATAVRAGLDPATPAVAVERATRPDERVVAAAIADMPLRLAAAPPSGPVVVMIGRVFAHHVETARNKAKSGPPEADLASRATPLCLDLLP